MERYGKETVIKVIKNIEKKNDKTELIDVCETW